MAKDLSKKFKDSPYDSAGMPLDCNYVDYDKKVDVAEATVTDKYVEPEHINDIEFDESVTIHDWQKRTKFNPALNNTAIQFPGHKIHKAHKDDIGTGLPPVEPSQVDLEDPAEARKAIVEDSIAKGIEVPKLPDVAKKEDVQNVIDDKTNTSDVSDGTKKQIVESKGVQRDTPKEQQDKPKDLIATAEGIKSEEKVNTLDKRNDPGDPDFMEALKNADKDGK